MNPAYFVFGLIAGLISVPVVIVLWDTMFHRKHDPKVIERIKQ